MPRPSASDRFPARAASDPPTRPSGVEAMLERFPHARGLWQLEATTARGFPAPFQLDAFALNGVVVIVQQFTGSDGWEIYIPACVTSGLIAATLDAVAEAVARPGLNGVRAPVALEAVIVPTRAD